MKRAMGLLISMLLAFSVTGCWSRVEVNDIAIVTATGIDAVENGDIRVSLLLAVPRLVGTSMSGTGGGGGGGGGIKSSAGWVVSADGKTIMDAYRRLQEKLPRRIFFAHSKIIVVGDTLARQGLLPVLDFFERYRQSQLKSYLVITKGEAAEILNFKPKFEKLASEVMKEELKLDVGASLRLVDFFAMLIAEGVEPHMPRLQITSSEVTDKETGTRTNGLRNLTLMGLAVFKGDKLIGWMSDKETRGLLWLRDEIKGGVVTVDLPPELGGGKVSAELENVHTRIKPLFRPNSVSFHMTTVVTGNLYENETDLNMTDSKTMNVMQTYLQKAIEQRIKLAAHTVQKKYKSDILGFGQIVYRHNPKAWHTKYSAKWAEIFPDVELQVDVRARLLRTGLTNQRAKSGGESK